MADLLSDTCFLPRDLAYESEVDALTQDRRRTFLLRWKQYISENVSTRRERGSIVSVNAETSTALSVMGICLSMLHLWLEGRWNELWCNNVCTV